MGASEAVEENNDGRDASATRTVVVERDGIAVEKRDMADGGAVGASAGKVSANNRLQMSAADERMRTKRRKVERNGHLFAVDPVLFDFAIQGGAAETEKLGGFGNGAVGALERFENEL